MPKRRCVLQVAGALDGREVARLVVAVDALQEVVQQFVRAGRCRWAARSACRLVRSKPSVLQRRHAAAARPGTRRQRRGVARRPGRPSGRTASSFFSQAFLYGVNTRVRPAAQRQHLAALEDHVVLGGVQRHAAVGQRAAHARVARQRRRFVVVVGVDRLHAQLACASARYRLVRPAVAHDQPARLRCRAQRPARAARRRRPTRLSRMNSTRRSCARQRVEDVAVEDEGAPHLARRLQRVVQGGMVVARAGRGAARRRALSDGLASRPGVCAGNRMPGHGLRRSHQPHEPVPDRHARHGRRDLCRHRGLPVRAHREGRARPGHQQADRHQAEEPVREGRAQPRPRRPGRAAGVLRRPGADRARLRAARQAGRRVPATTTPRCRSPAAWT